jgi:hypothetical protein
MPFGHETAGSLVPSVSSMSRDQAKTRKNRIFRRASETIRAAYVNGNITARRADILLHLEPVRAEAELAVILDRQARIAARSAVAARVIREHLSAGRRDLIRLEADLRSALA